MYDIKNLKIWKESPKDNPFLNRMVIIEIEAFFTEAVLKKEAEYCNVKSILEVGGVFKVNRVNNGRGLRFPIYLTERMQNTDIDALELSVRASNCLKRAGIHTIGGLCERIHSSSDLKTLRNCGNTSIAEIMDKLFYANYMSLPAEKRNEYIAKVIQMNTVTLE